MNPSSYYNTFTLSHILSILLAGDREHLNFVTCQSLTECFSNTEIGFDRVSHDAIQVIKHVSVGVRVAIREVHSVTRVFEVVAESLCVVSALDSTFFWPPQAIWIITDVSASAVPANVFVSSHPFTVHQDFHALIVKTVGLAQIQNVESNCLAH